MTDLTVKIANTTYPILNESWSFPDKIEQSSQCAFTIQDDNAAWRFSKGQTITVDDTLEGRIFTGSVHTVKRRKKTTFVQHEIECVDLHEVLESQSSDKQYIEQYAGAILIDQIRNLVYQGITANYAIDKNTTQGDFASGTLSGVVAVTNVGDGNLELAPAGSQVTILENTTALFATGTLTNMQASGNALVPTATPALKITATQSIAGIGNSYTYLKIWEGNVGVAGSRYLAYDIYISADSPEARVGVDFVCTDGTELRNNVVYYDAQHKSPHPNTDLAGLAVGKWYHRKMLLDNLSAKTIQYVTIAIEGDKPGTYTAWIKNIYKVDSSDVVKNTFFDSTLNVNPPEQMQFQGFGPASVTVVSTYDCSTASRVSPAYSIDAAKLLRNSFITSKTTLPTGYSYNLSYSIDAGNTYQVCTNNAALPNFPAGLSLASKSIQFQQTFTQDTGAQADQQPKLDSMQCVIQPSYSATKTDVTSTWATNSGWNAGTHSNTQASSNILQQTGVVRNWDDAVATSQTLYGGGATGPNTDTTCKQYVDSGQQRLFVYNSTAGIIRCDFAGTWQNFTLEFDVYIDASLQRPGCVYGTTNWGNGDDNYGYAVEISNTTGLSLLKGSNSSSSSTGTRTSIANVALALTSQVVHRVKVIKNGSNHKVYLDGVLLIDATDSTYSSNTAYVGLRISNTDPANGYIGLFDNFGITAALSSSWTSQSVSIASATTYGSSAVFWQDLSSNTDLVINSVQSSINGGGSWQDLVNGGAISGLTAGQSLSGVSVKFKVNFTSATATVLPQMQYLVCYVLGAFSSSGTRISSGLLLDAVGYCGSTLAAWNEVKPAGTTVAVATSLGSGYTDVSNGGSIAGITGQPAPTIDSFDLITSGSYTSTARTGGTSTSWVWDTANSRLTVSGGTNALLIYGAISASDVDEIFDFDQADSHGIVWRYTDASNYYELLAYDGSSSAGATNVLKLFKIVANVKTQIGSDIAVTLARTKKYRVRAIVIGTAITISVDGTTVRSTTDSALTGPGQCGLSSVSGSGRICNLRIQPIGDDLTGKKVYNRITLTSTDPISTPQVSDLTILATSPNIGIGALIPTADYRITYKSDNINDLAKRSGYFWTVKADGSMIFHDRRTVPAPWCLTGEDVLIEDLEVEESGDLYRNRHTIKGVIDTLTTNETQIGNGTATSWPLKYNVVSVSSVTLNGQVVIFGPKGGATCDFYYEVGSNTLAADSSLDVLQQTDALYIEYTGQFETSVTRDNTGQFPGTVSQADYIAQSGLTIPTLIILNQASAAQTTNGNSDDLDVRLCKNITVDINITANSGSTLYFIIDRKGADGIYYPIWQSVTISVSAAQISTSIGAFCAYAQSIGSFIRIRWIITGTSWTFSISILGKLDTSAAGIGVKEAIEDVSGQNMNVPAAQDLADSRLQEHGVIGHTVKFGTIRTGLTAGLDLSVTIPEHGLIDASMLITSVDRTQTVLSSGNQQYWYKVEAVEGAVLDGWGKAMNKALGSKA